MRHGIGVAQQQPLGDDGEHRCNQRAKQQGPQHRAREHADDIGRIRRHEIERAMREVHEAHQAEDHRQSDRQQEVDHPDADAVEQLEDEDLA